MKTEVSFFSEGSKISADLYLPENLDVGKKYPAIVLCHGFTGIKEVLLPAFAEEFAKNGFASLVFDYRGFGGSEGERGRLVPLEQVADIRSAIAFMETLPEVDGARIGLWGSSFGGANTITAAYFDKRVKALVVQLTFGSGERVITGKMSPEEKEKIRSTMKKLEQKYVLTGKQMMLSQTQVLSDPDSKAYFEKMIKEFPKVETKIPFLTVKRTMDYKPEEFLKEVNVPVLILGAEKDIVNPPDESKILFEKANEPKKLVMIKDASHYELYSGEKFKEAFAEELIWFKKYL